MKLTLWAAFLVTSISAVTIPVALPITSDAIAIVAGPSVPVGGLIPTVGPAQLNGIIIAILAVSLGSPQPPRPVTFLIHCDALSIPAWPSRASLHVFALGPAHLGTLVFAICIK